MCCLSLLTFVSFFFLFCNFFFSRFFCATFVLARLFWHVFVVHVYTYIYMFHIFWHIFLCFFLSCSFFLVFFSRVWCACVLCFCVAVLVFMSFVCFEVGGSIRREIFVFQVSDSFVRCSTKYGVHRHQGGGPKTLLRVNGKLMRRLKGLGRFWIVAAFRHDFGSDWCC